MHDGGPFITISLGEARVYRLIASFDALKDSYDIRLRFAVKLAIP
jgi:hypothetical protein